MRWTMRTAVVTLMAMFCWGSAACQPSQQNPPAPEPGSSPEPADETSPEEVSGSDDRLSIGIDVSSYSGAIDWTQVVAAGYGFAVAKATEGVDLADPDFAENWAGMGSAGLLRGAYHFYVTEDDPTQQASFFIETAAGLGPGDLVPAVDVETIGQGTEPGLAGRLQTFLDILEEHYGAKPLIYTSPNFWDQNLPAEFGAYPLWVAEYGVDAPRLPQGWSQWHLWQWQADAEIPGVESGADLDRANPAVEDLSALVIPHE